MEKKKKTGKSLSVLILTHMCSMHLDKYLHLVNCGMIEKHKPQGQCLHCPLILSHYSTQKATVLRTDLHLCRVVSTSINVSLHPACCGFINGGLMLINANSPSEPTQSKQRLSSENLCSTSLTHNWKHHLSAQSQSILFTHRVLKKHMFDINVCFCKLLKSMG